MCDKIDPIIYFIFITVTTPDKLQLLIVSVLMASYNCFFLFSLPFPSDSKSSLNSLPL